jgi:hypothetical protein
MSERSLSSDRAEHLDVLDRARDPEIDIWRAADLLTRQQGVNTGLDAARLVDDARSGDS